MGIRKAALELGLGAAGDGERRQASLLNGKMGINSGNVSWGSSEIRCDLRVNNLAQGQAE